MKAYLTCHFFIFKKNCLKVLDMAEFTKHIYICTWNFCTDTSFFGEESDVKCDVYDDIHNSEQTWFYAIYYILVISKQNFSKTFMV